MGNCQLQKPPQHPKSTVAYIGKVFYWGKSGGLLDGRMFISRNLQTSLAPCGTPSRCGSASPPLEAFVHRLGRRQLAPTPAYRCEHRVLSRRPEWWTLRITIWALYLPPPPGPQQQAYKNTTKKQQSSHSDGWGRQPKQPLWWGKYSAATFHIVERWINNPVFCLFLQEA